MVRDGHPDTPLTGCFKCNTKPEHQFGKHLLYSDYAELFRYHSQSKQWKVRNRGVDTVFGRVYFIMPNARELYFLPLLLNHVPSATCLAYLRTVKVKPVRTPVAIFGSLGVCIYVPASRHWLISYSPIHLA